MKKVISVLLAVLMLCSIAAPAAFAAGEEKTTSEHADFSEVVDIITDENGDVDWHTLPGTYLKIFAKIRIIEVIWNFFNTLFGGALGELFGAVTGAIEDFTIQAEPTS